MKVSLHNYCMIMKRAPSTMNSLYSSQLSKGFGKSLPFNFILWDPKLNILIFFLKPSVFDEIGHFQKLTGWNTASSFNSFSEDNWVIININIDMVHFFQKLDFDWDWCHLDLETFFSFFKSQSESQIFIKRFPKTFLIKRLKLKTGAQLDVLIDDFKKFIVGSPENFLDTPLRCIHFMSYYENFGVFGILTNYLGTYIRY